MNDDKLMPIKDAHIYLLYLLKQVNRVCENNDIIYFAHAGTLLGAVRHKGFIPWDDDIDLIMERKYYSIFVKACESMFPSEVVIRTRENDPFFCEEYIKICYKDDKCRFSDLSVDVFFLDETDPSRKLFRAFQNAIIKGVRPLKLYIASRRCEYMEKYIPHNLFKRVLLASFSFVPIGFLTNIQTWAMTAEKKQTEYYVDWGSVEGYKKATRPKRIYTECERIPFESQYVFASLARNEFLESGYGKDYMILPPPERRHVHNVKIINNNRLFVEDIERELSNEE